MLVDADSTLARRFASARSGSSHNSRCTNRDQAAVAVSRVSCVLPLVLTPNSL